VAGVADASALVEVAAETSARIFEGSLMILAGAALTSSRVALGASINSGPKGGSVWSLSTRAYNRPAPPRQQNKNFNRSEIAECSANRPCR
jgi:hypothetical protein